MSNHENTAGHYLLKFDVVHQRYVGVNNEVFGWLADDLQGDIDLADKEKLEDFLQQIYLEKAKFACNCQSGSDRIEYSARKSKKSFRTHVLTPANEHRLGCRLRPKAYQASEQERRLLDNFISHVCVTSTADVPVGLGIENGVDQRWLANQATAVWESDNLPLANIGFSALVLPSMLNDVRSGSIAQAIIVGRYSGSKNEFKLKLVEAEDDFCPPVCGPFIDYRGVATISGRHYGLCVLQLSDDGEVIATHAAAFTLMTSGWPIPVRDMETRWAVFTLAAKVAHVKNLHPNAEIRVDIRYDNGFADPTSFVLHLPSHTAPRVIAVRKRAGEICVPESLQPYLTGSQFIIHDPARRSTLDPRRLTKAHKSFKKSVYAELQNGVI